MPRLYLKPARLASVWAVCWTTGLAVPSPARAQAPLEAQTPARAARASAALERSLEALARRPRRAELARALRLLATLEGVAHSYFHAPNLEAAAARAPALALRPWIAAQLFGAHGIWRLGPDDVIRVRPALRDALAEAALALGMRAEAARQVRAAIAAGGESPRRTAWLEAATSGEARRVAPSRSGVQGAALEVDQER